MIDRRTTALIENAGHREYINEEIEIIFTEAAEKGIRLSEVDASYALAKNILNLNESIYENDPRVNKLAFDILMVRATNVRHA